jgi:glycolate oxidase iron-sulfur subunit
MAARLQKRKVANILRVTPEIVATANPGCAMQMAAGLRETGSEIAIKHVVELLDESYAAYKPSMRPVPASASSSV